MPNKYYPLELAFSYQALRHGHIIHRGLGETTEISSTCIRVKPLDSLCLAATDVVMSITWPAKLKDGTSLQFVILAKPSWDGLDLDQFVIVKHEFRTASNRPLGVGLRTGFGAVKAVRMPHEPRQDESLSFHAQSNKAAFGA